MNKTFLGGWLNLLIEEQELERNNSNSANAEKYPKIEYRFFENIIMLNYSCRFSLF